MNTHNHRIKTRVTQCLTTRTVGLCLRQLEDNLKKSVKVNGAGRQTLALTTQPNENYGYSAKSASVYCLYISSLTSNSEPPP